jgi:hypothetical protein
VEATANTYNLATITPINQPLLIRQGTSGLILGSSEVKSVRIRSDDMTGNLATESYPTYDVIELPLVVNGDLNTVEIRCEIIIGGVTFTDGSSSKSLTQTSFNEFNTTQLYFKKPINAHSVCHRYSVWCNDIRIAYFN